MSHPILLLLVCLLPIHSGVAQYAGKGGCCDTSSPQNKPTDSLLKRYKERVKSYEECQHSKVRLQFEKGHICASKHDNWVQELICHIKPESTDSFCAKYKDSRSGPDYSKGSEKAPPTSPPAGADANVVSNSNQAPGGAVTQRVPTTAPSSKEAAPSEYTTVPGDYEDVPSEYPVSPREFAVGNQKEKDSERRENLESTEGKKEGVTSFMKTAIISLVFISLFLVALVAFLICRRRKGPEPATEQEKEGLSSA
ncbi:uncharacterized protein LOC108703506 [Xenopus laevis]|uniref:C-X-C motif chemokine 16 n=1 Tax=Xenopus laevis TaxID=8355 RepID=A0A8J0TUQ0_XENLA|nr:uncharacterized protein LOC108703506 [Xenopus laevis]OCT59419.1 hypothetical protein XELAEV_18000841mg [Xenopus laevis]